VEVVVVVVEVEPVYRLRPFDSRSCTNSSIIANGCAPPAPAPAPPPPPPPHPPPLASSGEALVVHATDRRTEISSFFACVTSTSHIIKSHHQVTSSSHIIKSHHQVTSSRHNGSAEICSFCACVDQTRVQRDLIRAK
jgi:hypothetical protein